MWQCAVFSLSIWDWTGIVVQPYHLAFVLAFNSNRVEGIQIVVIQSAASCIVYAGSNVRHGNTWQQSTMDKKKNGGACSKNFSDIWWWTTPFKAFKSGQHSNSKTTSKNYHSKDASKWKGNRSRQLPNALLRHYARPHNATSTSVFLKLCVGVPTKKQIYRNRNGIISWPIYCMKLDHNLGFLIWRNPHTSSTMHGKKIHKMSST